MLNITAIEEAIDAFIATNPPEDYHVRISKDDRQRPYLGLSGLGETCMRKVWYGWRHCVKPKFPSRMLRLFRRGDREEFVFLWLLRGIGFEVFDLDENGKQFSVEDFEGHVKGNTDGVGKAPKKFWKRGATPHAFLLEMKTVNDAGFKKYTKNGVEKVSPKYFGQIQGYCGYLELEGALFCMVNKNDDSLYFEYVPFNKRKFQALVDKAEDIVHAQAPPDRMACASVSWYECKYCDAFELCFKAGSSQKLCRTCIHASPGENKSWVCAKGHEFGTVCKDYKDIARQ